MTASSSRRPLLIGGILIAALFVVFRLWSGGGERIEAADFTSRPADALVVDVRTDGEWAGGHLAGAIHVPLGDGLEAAMDGYDRDRPVYLYCASGARSGRAASILEGMGFTRVVNAGGMSSLAAAGAEVAP